MKVSIIIPAHNEEKRISNTLEEYCKFFEKRKKTKELKDFEILVVLNACTDRTIEIVKKAEKRFKEIKHLEFELGGKGFAVKEGFKESLKKDFDLIGFVDADMATSPEAFDDLVNNINGYDGIIGSRWIGGSVIKTKQPFLRRVMSRGFNFIVRSLFLLPYIDTQCGAKLFKRKTLERVITSIGATKWAFDVDLLYRLNKEDFKIKEFPTIWEDKEKSKLNIKKVPFQMFASIIRLRLIYSPFKDLVRLYNILPEKMKINNW